MKRKSKKCMQGKYVNQCVLQENKSSISKQEYKANVYIEDDKNLSCYYETSEKTVCDGKKSQSTKSYKNSVYSDKNCQEFPVKPAQESNHMWSATRSSNKKSVDQQATRTVKLSDVTRKTIQCLMTRFVNLMCVLTRTVKIPSLCSQWSQQWICG